MKWVVVTITIAFGSYCFYAAAETVITIPYSAGAVVETTAVAASYLSSYFFAAAATMDVQNASLNCLEKSFTSLGEAFFFLFKYIL